MEHFKNLIALLIKDWQKRDGANHGLPQNTPKFGGWLGPQRASAPIADRVEEMHSQPGFFCKSQNKWVEPERCALYLFTDYAFMTKIFINTATPKALEELRLFLSLSYRARQAVLNHAHKEYDSMRKKNEAVVA